MKNVEDMYPLSPLQQGLLFHTLYAPQSGMYCEQQGIMVYEPLNIDAFQTAWRNLVARHSILRTSFVWDGLAEPLQVVHQQVNIPWVIDDLQHLTKDEQDAYIKNLYQMDRARGFVLTRAPLLRLTVLELSSACFHCFWSYHHILLDGWSVTLLLDELSHIYKALCQGTTPTLPRVHPYREYIAWLRTQDLASAESFWRSHLAGFTTPTPLVMDQSSESIPESDVEATEACVEVNLSLSQRTTTTYLQFARQNQLTLNTLVQGAWALLLSRYSGEADVLFGTTVSTRPPTLVGAETMVGLFINTIPTRVDVTPQAQVLPWLTQLQKAQGQTSIYHNAPLMHIQQWSEVPAGQPLFESLLVVENFPQHTSQSKAQPNATDESWSSAEQTNYALVMSVEPGAELLLRLSYKRSRFAAATIERMLRQYQNLLAAIVAHPQHRLQTLSFLTEQEHDQILQWNATQQPWPYAQDSCLHHLLEAQAASTPEALALVYQEQQLTYHMLNARANQLAHVLQTKGVGPDVLVALCLERSFDLVIGILGILKAGGAYVPLDPTAPQERLAALLHATQIHFLFTSPDLTPLFHACNVEILCADAYATQDAKQDNPTSSTISAHLAYAIFTSGSTGIPKSVAIPHQALINHMDWMQHQFPLEPADRVLQKTPSTFDASVWEFFAPLLVGAQLIIAEPHGHRDREYLCRVIKQQAVTRLQVVPTLLRHLLQGDLATCHSLRHVFCGGEVLATDLVAAYHTQIAAELHNLYGPTETTIQVTFWTCERTLPRSSIPLGRPIANTQIYILDALMQPVPVYVAGECYIGGMGLARGYLHQPDLTAERFVPDPFSSQAGMRLYRTGDRARYLADGTLEFLGRLDQQIKLRGQRIELGEIEAALTQHPAVQAAVVTVYANQPDDQRLLAYVVAVAETDLAPALYTYLKQRLPEYMLPATFVLLEALPLLPNGKVDRRALPVVDPLSYQARAVDSPPPRNAVEERLASIWAELLQVQAIGVHDNFFALGGHSLLATQVASRIRELFQIELPLRVLFDSPTIAQQADAIVLQALEEADEAVIANMLAQRE